MASQGDSSSSNYKNSNSSGGSNPFEKPSYKNRSNGSYSFYDEHGEKDIDKNNEIAYLILCESKFKFKIIYDKEEELRNKILMSSSNNNEAITKKFTNLMDNIRHLTKTLNSLQKSGYPNVINFTLKVKDSIAYEENDEKFIKRRMLWSF